MATKGPRSARVATRLVCGRGSRFPTAVLLLVASLLSGGSIANTIWWVGSAGVTEGDYKVEATLWEKAYQKASKVRSRFDCRTSEECEEGTFCSAGLKKCLSDSDCNWLNTMQTDKGKPKHDCSRLPEHSNVQSWDTLCDIASEASGCGSIFHVRRLAVAAAVLPLLGCLFSLLCRPRSLLPVGLACLSFFTGCAALLLALFMDMPAARLWGLGVAFQSSAVVVAALAALMTLCARVARPTLKEGSVEHQEVMGLSGAEVYGAQYADLEAKTARMQALEAKTGSLATSEDRAVLALAVSNLIKEATKECTEDFDERATDVEQAACGRPDPQHACGGRRVTLGEDAKAGLGSDEVPCPSFGLAPPAGQPWGAADLAPPVGQPWGAAEAPQQSFGSAAGAAWVPAELAALPPPPVDAYGSAPEVYTEGPWGDDGAEAIPPMPGPPGDCTSLWATAGAPDAPEDVDEDMPPTWA